MFLTLHTYTSYFSTWQLLATEAQLSIQDGMIVDIYFDFTQIASYLPPVEYQFGSIKTTGNVQMAEFFVENFVPKVRYIDGYEEPILPLPAEIK